MNLRQITKNLRSYLALVVLVIASFSSQAATDEQYKVETAFIYQFTNYITWPPDSTKDAFVISVVGDSKLTRSLEKLAQVKTVKGQKMLIHQITDSSQLKRSDIVVIGSSNEKILDEITKKTKGTHALIISFSHGFATKGSMINFYLDDGRIRFEINRAALEAEKLQASSQLLKLARLVD